MNLRIFNWSACALLQTQLSSAYDTMEEDSTAFYNRRLDEDEEENSEEEEGEHVGYDQNEHDSDEEEDEEEEDEEEARKVKWQAQ